MDGTLTHAFIPSVKHLSEQNKCDLSFQYGKKETGMSTNIYVGNLPVSATEDKIRELFNAYGTVERVNLITDRETGRLKGFGFVEMTSGGQEVIAALDQRELDGRQLSVSLARPREERSSRSPSRPRRW